MQRAMTTSLRSTGQDRYHVGLTTSDVNLFAVHDARSLVNLDLVRTFKHGEYLWVAIELLCGTHGQTIDKEDSTGRGTLDGQAGLRRPRSDRRLWKDTSGEREKERRYDNQFHDRLLLGFADEQSALLSIGQRASQQLRDGAFVGFIVTK